MGRFASQWAINLQPFAGLIAEALRGVRRSAPVELIGFDAGAARFANANGELQIDFADVEVRTFEGRTRQSAVGGRRS